MHRRRPARRRCPASPHPSRRHPRVRRPPGRSTGLAVDLHRHPHRRTMMRGRSTHPGALPRRAEQQHHRPRPRPLPPCPRPHPPRPRPHHPALLRNPGRAVGTPPTRARPPRSRWWTGSPDHGPTRSMPHGRAPPRRHPCRSSAACRRDRATRPVRDLPPHPAPRSSRAAAHRQLVRPSGSSPSRAPVRARARRPIPACAGGRTAAGRPPGWPGIGACPLPGHRGGSAWPGVDGPT